MNLLRKIKIDTVTPLLTEREKEVIEYVDSWFKELRLFHTKANTLHTYFAKSSVFVIRFDDYGNAFIRHEIFDVLQKITTYDDAEKYLIHMFEKRTGLGGLKNISPIKHERYKTYEKEYKEYKLTTLLRK